VRISRLVQLVSGLGAAVSVFALAAPAQAATINYVALGDSYSAGVGAGSYISSSGSCSRSTRAFSALWAAGHSVSSYKSVACSGATTASVTAGQVSALRSSTTLVSITIGGNDVGFSHIMKTCILSGTSSCVAAVSQAENVARTQLPARLDSAYRAISAHAPHARVVVIDYPVFYQLGVQFCIGLSATSRAKIDEGISLLDGIISAAAGRHHFTFADVRSRFVGHQLCSSDKWLHSLNYTHITESYHPTSDGQKYGYLPVFTGASG
jgi:lysophospholipase L1-like esterase